MAAPVFGISTRTAPSGAPQLTQESETALLSAPTPRAAPLHALAGTRARAPSVWRTLAPVATHRLGQLVFGLPAGNPLIPAGALGIRRFAGCTSSRTSKFRNLAAPHPNGTNVV